MGRISEIYRKLNKNKFIKKRREDHKISYRKYKTAIKAKGRIKFAKKNNIKKQIALKIGKFIELIEKKPIR